MTKNDKITVPETSISDMKKSIEERKQLEANLKKFYKYCDDNRAEILEHFNIENDGQGVYVVNRECDEKLILEWRELSEYLEEKLAYCSLLIYPKDGLLDYIKSERFDAHDFDLYLYENNDFYKSGDFWEQGDIFINALEEKCDNLSRGTIGNKLHDIAKKYGINDDELLDYIGTDKQIEYYKRTHEQ